MNGVFIHGLCVRVHILVPFRGHAKTAPLGKSDLWFSLSLSWWWQNESFVASKQVAGRNRNTCMCLTLVFKAAGAAICYQNDGFNQAGKRWTPISKSCDYQGSTYFALILCSVFTHSQLIFLPRGDGSVFIPCLKTFVSGSILLRIQKNFTNRFISSF